MRDLSRRDRVLALVVPVLLVVVAIYQLGTTQLADQTPWRGGGFGMFATVDHVDLRVLRVTFETPDGEVPVDVSSLLDEDDPRHGRAHLNLRARPTEQHAGHFVEALHGTAWSLEDDVAVLAPEVDVDGEAPEVTDDATVTVDRVQAEVWRVGYERGRDEIRPHLVRTLVRDVGGEG